VQGLVNQEAGRYADYVRRFNAILEALPQTTTIPPLDPEPVDPAGPADPADPGAVPKPPAT